ncbi:NAD(P)H-binding protein [Agarivorans sp. B2Z047]|uniref:NAD(P)H-binding protein n=1 Tax=Agarivorans sp. B2Z047 TaxID=2652721 RepID=UPI00128E4F1D|nr:NAD(P)H-binding protein [Agarivorans sp. B2Z047]MPW28099.1 NAD(P)H-binding protein [Agarivorans sp. B2Z047]UQN44071.1 NAD(P)H-binding protein [Agarivorans sp. B2Z047]
MKTALILGINGNFGLEMALALSKAGWSIKALVRDPNKVPSFVEAKLIVGDALKQQQVMAAAQGVDLIVYALNPPYHRWQRQALPLLEPCLQVAEQLGLRVLFPGNVYNFNPQASLIDENQTMHPPSEKGQIRVKMEQRLKQASENGAKVTIVRAGDFIGPHTHLSWISTMVKHKKDRYQVAFPHNQEHVHFWSYLPDLCANTVQLLEQSQVDFEVWHDSGLSLSRKDWQQAFASNGTNIKSTNLAWWGFSIIAPFVPMLKEVLKMRYLWQQPVILDGSKMRQALQKSYQSTPLSQVLQQLKLN